MNILAHMSCNTPPNIPSPLHALRGHTSSVNTVKFTSCGSSLVSGTTEGEIKLWNVCTKRNTFSTKQPNGIVKLHELDQYQIVSHETSGNIAVWDLNMGKSSLMVTSEWNPYSSESPEPLGHSVHVSVAKSAIDEGVSGTPIIAVSTSQRDSYYINLLDVRQQQLVQSYKDSSKLGLCLTVAFIHNESNNPLLCGGFENGGIQWWDLRVPDRPLRNAWYQAHEEPVLCFDIDSATCRGISGGADAKLSVFKLDSEQVTCIHSVDLPNSGIADLKIRRDKRIFVSAGWDHRVRVYSWKKYTPLAILQYHCKSVTCVDFPTKPQDGKFLLAVGSKDKQISLWDIYNG